MLSYWCNARCRFCYVNAGPRHSYWADPDQLVEWWQSLQRLARRFGKDVKIHLTGGEPFGNWPLLVNVLEKARQADLPPVQKIETNAYWAQEPATVRSRLERLKALSVPLISVAADIYHQQFVPFANVRLLVETAREILGPQGVRVRWWDFYNSFDDNRPPCPDQERMTAALLAGRDRLTGRAAELAGQLLQGKPPEELGIEHRTCAKAILASRHVHIDPYGNVFAGTCSGLILGSAVVESPQQIWQWLDETGPTGPIFESLVKAGPLQLYRLAVRHGFKADPNGYVGACQLCYFVRRFLFRRNLFRKWLGPAECYG